VIGRPDPGPPYRSPGAIPGPGRGRAHRRARLPANRTGRGALREPLPAPGRGGDAYPRPRLGRPGSQAEHVYRLRSACAAARAGGACSATTKRQVSWYACAPKEAYRPDGHPIIFRVREDHLLAGLAGFLYERVFGPYRRQSGARPGPRRATASSRRPASG
jgi:hypothetical protein